VGAFSAEIMKRTACNTLHLLQTHDLSFPRFVTLMYIGRKGCASISGISEHLNLTLGTTSHLVDQLVAAGIVTRYENPDDRRLKHIQLTKRGQELVGEIQRMRVAELTRRLEQLPAPLQQRLFDVMTDVIAVLKDQQAVPDHPVRPGHP
jgi:DNA-binding MarR family transcriptional regulator